MRTLFMVEGSRLEARGVIGAMAASIVSIVMAFSSPVLARDEHETSGIEDPQDVLLKAGTHALKKKTEQLKIKRARIDMQTIGFALERYQLDTGTYPTTLEALVWREASGDGEADQESSPGEVNYQELKFSVLGKTGQVAPSEVEKWNGPYLEREQLLDPWGGKWHYSRDSQHDQDYDLWSLGPDGQPGNDDITNWE